MDILVDIVDNSTVYYGDASTYCGDVIIPVTIVPESALRYAGDK